MTSDETSSPTPQPSGQAVVAVTAPGKHTKVWLLLTGLIWALFVIPPINAIATGSGDIASNAGKLTGAIVWPAFWMTLIMFGSRIFLHRWPTHVARWLFLVTLLSLYACPFRK
jgi:hypothetical protein